MSKNQLRMLSELEGVCLGIVSKHGPCTAYRVRCVLKQAPSSHWRASAGSVYPLLARLEAGGLLTSITDAEDRRGTKLVKITARGQKSLKAWIAAGRADEYISSVADPLRSRIFFLDVLSPGQRAGFVDDLIVQMEHYLVAIQAYLEGRSEDDDLHEHLGALGAVITTRARLEWLKVIRERL